MWCKSATLCRSRFTRLHALRWIHKVQSASHLQNPGSEPLTIATLGDVIAETAHKYPGRVAVKSKHEGIRITYEELLNQADALGCALRSQGLQKGDRLGLWSHNSVSWIVAAVAAARAGLISVLLNPIYEHNEISFCIRKTQMKGLFIGETLPNRNYYGILEKLIPELHSSKAGDIKSKDFPCLTSVIVPNEKLDGTLELGSLIKNHQNTSDISKYGTEVKPEEGCLIHLTSGTTGEPKAALDSHIGVVNNTYFSGIRNELHQGHQTVCVQAPLFHALGSVITSLAALRLGASMVLAAPTYNVNANIDAVLSENCSIITGTPTMYVDMLGRLRQRGDKPGELKVALAAGAPCSPQLIRDIQTNMNVQSVKALYGLTETTACVFQSLPGDSIDKVAETVGYITDHTEVKVVDENGQAVPFGSPGELLSRGYNNMIGYWDEPEKTSKAIDKDGWVWTGDQFTISEDGYGRVVGRLKDIIVRGGENIAPKEIEDVLNTHPDIIESQISVLGNDFEKVTMYGDRSWINVAIDHDFGFIRILRREAGARPSSIWFSSSSDSAIETVISESQVVGVSDDRLGEELCAVLRLKEGASVTLDDITKHCTGHIARYKLPRIVKVTEVFPKTTSGKIQKFKVKQLIEAGKL